jgi:hypothetical protein
MVAAAGQQPSTGGNAPTLVDLRSEQNQPFCDGSHKGTGLAQKMFKANKTEVIYFCGCKQSTSPEQAPGMFTKFSEQCLRGLTPAFLRR